MDGLCSFRINVRKKWQLRVQQSRQLQRQTSFFSRQWGPRGLTSHTSSSSPCRGRCLHLLVVSLLTQVKHRHPESLQIFYQPNTLKSLQVNLESKDSLRKSKIKAKHDVDYFKHLSLEKQFEKQPKVRHSAVQFISQTKSSKCAMQWTWGQRWTATLCPLHEFAVKEEKWMHNQIIKCNEMDALWCKVAQRAERTVIHTRYKHLGGVVWNHHQSE